MANAKDMSTWDRHGKNEIYLASLKDFENQIDEVEAEEK